MNENKKSKLVFDARVARALCKKNFPIIDIKPMRGEPDKTVFVFANTEEFQGAFSQIMDEMKTKAEAKKGADTPREEYVQLKLDDSY